MEASDTSGQAPQEPGQTDATGQDQNPEQPTSAQEQPTQDSNLTTPQPDQPAPSESDRQAVDSANDSAQAPADAAIQQDESAGLPPQYPTTAQQDSAAVEREQELEAARRTHNERTGGGDVQPNEVQDARQAHNERTGGGDVPGTSSDSDDAPDSGLGQE